MFRKIFLSMVRLIGYIPYFISGLIPRNNNLWVFGSFGVFNDNSRYLYQYLVSHPEYNITPVWISGNGSSISEAKKYGKAYHKFSLRGLYFCLTAKVYVFSSYISDINFFTSRNAIKVNLWHGIPLKKIEFDIKTKPLSDIFRDASLLSKLLRPHVRVKYDLVLSPSQFIADYSFKSAFRITDNEVILAQYPRVTDLQECEKLANLSTFDKVILYAPTWRDSGQDFILESGIDFSELNEIMKRNNAILLVKLHSSTKLNINLEQFSHISLIDNKTDPNKLMKSSDILISDYSSIYFDYAMLDRPILHFCFDLDKYQQNRELYFDYREALGGDVVYNFSELKENLNLLLNNKESVISLENRKSLRERFLQSIGRKNREIVLRIMECYK